MKQKQLVSLLENKSIVVPLLFFKEYKKLNISLEEFMFLMYLKDKGNTLTLRPNSSLISLGSKVKVLPLSDRKSVV